MDLTSHFAHLANTGWTTVTTSQSVTQNHPTMLTTWNIPPPPQSRQSSLDNDAAMNFDFIHTFDTINSRTTSDTQSCNQRLNSDATSCSTDNSDDGAVFDDVTDLEASLSDLEASWGIDAEAASASGQTSNDRNNNPGQRADKRKFLSREEKRNIRRERNKVAATRCRQRRVEVTNLLLAETKSLENENAKLDRDIRDLESTKSKLQLLLQSHLNAPYCKLRHHYEQLDISSSTTSVTFAIMTSITTCPSSLHELVTSSAALPLSTNTQLRLDSSTAQNFNTTSRGALLLSCDMPPRSTRSVDDNVELDGTFNVMPEKSTSNQSDVFMTSQSQSSNASNDFSSCSRTGPVSAPDNSQSGWFTRGSDVEQSPNFLVPEPQWSEQFLELAENGYSADDVLLSPLLLDLIS